MPFISLLTNILIGWVIGRSGSWKRWRKNGEHFGRAKAVYVYDTVCCAGGHADPVFILDRILESDFSVVVENKRKYRRAPLELSGI